MAEYNVTEKVAGEMILNVALQRALKRLNRKPPPSAKPSNRVPLNASGLFRLGL
jgi:hypothetical protein